MRGPGNERSECPRKLILVFDRYFQSISMSSSAQIESEPGTMTDISSRKKKVKHPKIKTVNNKDEIKEEAITRQDTDLSKFFRSVCETKLKSMILVYGRLLEQKLKTPLVKTLEIWNELAAKSGLEVELPPPEEHHSEIKICQHYMPRAKKSCTSAVSSKSKTGKYCGSHLKYENKSEEKEPEKKLCEYVSKNGNKCNKKVSDKDESCKFCTKHLKTANSEEKPKSKKEKAETSKKSGKNSEVVLRPRKHSTLGVYVDKTTNLVIDNETKKIYGKLEADQIIPLRKEDEEWLQKHHYEYDMDMWSVKNKNKLQEKKEEEKNEENDEKDQEHDEKDDSDNEENDTD